MTQIIKKIVRSVFKKAKFCDLMKILMIDMRFSELVRLPALKNENRENLVIRIVETFSQLPPLVPNIFKGSVYFVM